jgi:hypothetical protein
LLLGAIAGLAASSAALSLHAFSAIVARAATLARDGLAISPASLLPALGLTDGLLAGLTAILLWVLIWLEWRRRAISTMLWRANPTETWILLVILLLWLGHGFCFPGVLLAADSGSHIARFLEVSRGLQEGIIPQWTNYQYLGSPLLAFTGPLTYILGGILTLAVGDAVIAVKILATVAHVLTGLFYYIFLRVLGLSRAAALIAAVGWTGSFAYLQMFLYRGLFPQLITVMLLPVLFLSAERLMRRERAKGGDWLLFAVTTAGLIVNHQPHAPFAAIYLALFGGISLLLGRWRWRGILPMATAGLVGCAMAAIAVLPVLEGSSWVMMEPESGLALLRWPTAERLLRLVTWANTRSNWGSDYWAYLGIASVALAAFGAWTSLSGSTTPHRRSIALAVVPCVLVGLVLYNPVVRDIMFLGFFIGLLVALAIEALLASRPVGHRILLLALVVVLLDIASTAILPVARPDKEFLAEAGHYLQKTAPNERTMGIGIQRDGSFQADTGPGAGVMSYFATPQRISGHHNMAATLVHNYSGTSVNLAERDLRWTGRLSAPIATLLAQFNASRIVCADPATMGCPTSFLDAEPEGSLGRRILVPDASPVLFSRSLVALSPPDGMDKPALWDPIFEFEPMAPRVAAIARFLRLYLDTARIDPVRHTARALPVRQPPPGTTNQSERFETVPVLEEYAVSLTRVELVIAAEQSGFAQLAHPWYPGNEVRINGVVTTPLQGAISLLVLPLEIGRNHIVIEPRTTPMTRLAVWISATALIGALGVAGLLGWRNRQRSEVVNSVGGE